MSRTIFSVTCTLGRVRAEWAYDFSSQMPPMGRKMMVAFLTDMTTSDARNTGMAMAQFSDAQYVMFWDDDILPKDNEAIAKMVTAMDQHPEIDVLGGVYPCRRQVCDPIVVKDGPYGGVWWGWQDGNIHPVYLTGTGFTLVRLERLPLPESYQIEVPGQGRIAARRYFSSIVTLGSGRGGDPCPPDILLPRDLRDEALAGLRVGKSG